MGNSRVNFIWTHREEAVGLTNIALEHYAVHKKIVLRKLKLAQKATEKHKKQQKFTDTQGGWNKFKTAMDNLWLSRKKSDDIWSEIITLFSRKAVYEDDLFHIEALLEKMPKDAHVIFLKLQNKDKSLNQLYQGLNREAYQQAKKKISDVQKQKNPLTGLSSEDYEQGLFSHIKALLFDDV